MARHQEMGKRGRNLVQEELWNSWVYEEEYGGENSQKKGVWIEEIWLGWIVAEASVDLQKKMCFVDPEEEDIEMVGTVAESSVDL